jgi:hypothetical protein
MRWLARLLLLRILPRRLLPIMTAWELFRLFRNRNRRDELASPPPRNVTPGAASRRPPAR